MKQLLTCRAIHDDIVGADAGEEVLRRRNKAPQEVVISYLWSAIR
jgi:hypothetical protein